MRPGLFPRVRASSGPQPPSRRRFPSRQSLRFWTIHAEVDPSPTPRTPIPQVLGDPRRGGPVTDPPDAESVGWARSSRTDPWFPPPQRAPHSPVPSVHCRRFAGSAPPRPRSPSKRANHRQFRLCPRSKDRARVRNARQWRAAHPRPPCTFRIRKIREVPCRELADPELTTEEALSVCPGQRGGPARVPPNDLPDPQVRTGKALGWALNLRIRNTAADRSRAGAFASVRIARP